MANGNFNVDQLGLRVGQLGDCQRGGAGLVRKVSVFAGTSHPSKRGINVNMRVGVQLAIIIAAQAVFTSSVRAGDSDGSGMYFGIGAGASRTTIDDLTSGINQSLLRAGFTS